MNRDQTITQLCKEFTNRIAQYHSNPSSVAISKEEMTSLFNVYPVGILLESARRTASLVKKENTLSLDKIVRAFKNITARQLSDAHAKSRYMSFSGTGTSIPKPKTQQVSKADRTAAIQAIFHERVGSLHPDNYTLYPSEAERLLDLPSERLTEILEKTKVWLKGEQGERTVDPQEISDYLFWEAQEHLQVVQR